MSATNLHGRDEVLREGDLRRCKQLGDGGQDAVSRDARVAVDQQYELPHAHVSAPQERLVCSSVKGGTCTQPLTKPLQPK